MFFKFVIILLGNIINGFSILQRPPCTIRKWSIKEKLEFLDVNVVSMSCSLYIYFRIYLFIYTKDWTILNKNNFYKHMFFKFFIILFGNISNGFFQYYAWKTISLKWPLFSCSQGSLHNIFFHIKASCPATSTAALMRTVCTFKTFSRKIPDWSSSFKLGD